MGRRIYKKTEALLPVEKPNVGGLYHVSWAKHGCVWRLLKIDETTGIATMITPKTRKEITVKVSDLRHTRSAQTKILAKK